MKTDLQIGNLTAAPGQKITGECSFPVNGQPFNLPVYLINGDKEGPTFVITAGVHAAEYASIAAALEIGQKYSPESIVGQLIVAPLINQAGFPMRSIYVNPLDGVNLNRVFPGSPNGSPSEQITAWVFEHIIRQADFYFDLHGGDLIEALVPFGIFAETGHADLDQKTQELAEVTGIEYLVSRQAISGSTFAAAAGAGIPAVLLEAGGQGIWPRSEVQRLITAVERAMARYGMLPPQPAAAARPILLKEFLWLYSEINGFWYPQTAVGEQVKAGQLLGTITDIWGKLLQEAHAPADGVVLFLVSSLSTNQGDPLLAVGA
jgi:predicted deacylase